MVEGYALLLLLCCLLRAFRFGRLGGFAIAWFFTASHRALTILFSSAPFYFQ